MADESINQSWYLCKENIEPLAKGRDVSKIEEAFTKPSGLDSIRAQYEEKILLDEGDDPLKNWVEFIDWIEQSYPDGGKDGKLKDVIADCVRRFIDDSRYNEDARFYSIFSRYFRHVPEPLEIFSSLFGKQVFVKLAPFYIDWSWLFEGCGNFKEADNVLDRGLLIGAEPSEDITTARLQLQSRLAKKIALGEHETREEEAYGQRKALAGLKPLIKKDKALAPVDRVSTIKPDAQIIPVASTSSAPVALPKIYEDAENLTPEKVIPTGSVKSSVVVNTKENNMKPGKWNEFRIRNKSVPKPQKEFLIYEDPEEEQQTTPLSVDIAPDVLKVRKRRDDSPALVKEEALAPNQKFYCDLSQIYVAGSEYSFEEIRYMKFMRAKKLQEEKKAQENLFRRMAELENKEADIAVLVEMGKKWQGIESKLRIIDELIGEKKKQEQKEIERDAKEKERDLKDAKREEEDKARREKDKEREEKDKLREEKDRELDEKDKERKEHDKLRIEKDQEREEKDKEREVKDKEREVKDKEREVKDKEREEKDNEREKSHQEFELKESAREQNERERQNNEKERFIQEKAREIGEKDRELRSKERDQTIQALESKLSTIISYLKDKKPVNCEVSSMVRNLLNGSYNETQADNTATDMPMPAQPAPVKDFTIYRDPTIEIAPLIRFDVSEPARSENASAANPLKQSIEHKLEINPRDDFIARASMNYRISEAFTMMVPNSEDECVPKLCSTPGK